MSRREAGAFHLMALKLGNRGQATVEYAIVAVALLAIVLGLSAVGSRLEEGLFVRHAVESASHAFGPNLMGSIGDVLLY